MGVGLYPVSGDHVAETKLSLVRMMNCQFIRASRFEASRQMLVSTAVVGFLKYSPVSITPMNRCPLSIVATFALPQRRLLVMFKK